MKKKYLVLAFGMVLSMNTFSGIVLGNKSGITSTATNFLLDKEIKSLLFGYYDVDSEIVVIVKSRNDPISIEKKEKEALNDMRKATKSYSETILKEYLDGTLLTGNGFDSKKMAEFAEIVSNDTVKNLVKEGQWITSKNEVVMLYKVNKSELKIAAASLFRERLGSVIYKLNSYMEMFDRTQSY